MRIVMVGPDIDVMGGISYVLIEYLKSGLHKKTKFSFIPSTKDGSKIYKSVFYLKTLKKVCEDLLNRKNTIFHLHVSQNGSFYRKIIIFGLAKITKKKVISHIHGSKFERFMNKGAVNRYLVRTMLNNSDLVITLSEEFKSVVSSFTKKAKVIKLYNPIRLPKKNSKKVSKTLNILFMGRLSHRKGIFDLLECIEKNRAYLLRRNVKFILAGDGDLNRVKDYIKRNKLAEVTDVPGWISGTHKQDLLENADILILPSYNEQMPMSILEAMSYGLPIISTKIAGIPEMVENEKNGFLIDPGNIDSLSTVIKKLIDNKDKRLQMGQESYKKITLKFEGKIIVDRLISIYNNL